MDSFKLLKRRTTDLLSSIPQSLPSIQSLNIGQHGHGHGHHHGGGHATMKGTWEKISGLPPLPRSSHSVNIVAGNVYIFGGESASARKPADNDMHVVALPSSGAPADYYTIKAVPAPREPTPVPSGPPGGEGGEVSAGHSHLPSVPSPRIGHATATIGHRIFLFGGRGGPDMSAIDEGGRVWVFDTRSRQWSYLDPVLPTAAVPPQTPSLPAPRSYHVAIATDKPGEFNLAPHHPKPVTRTETWKDWALGDSDEVGIPQRPIVGNVAARAVDTDSDGYGTLIIHGGCLAGGARVGDVWAFDVHSRVWQRLPDAPGAPRGGAALALARGKLYRFGGFNGTTAEGSRLDFLELGVDRFDDGFSAGEVSLVARGTWQSLLQNKEEDVGYKEVDTAEAPLTEEEIDPWPGARSVARLEAVTVGGGREYLVLMLGEKDPSNAGHEAAGTFWDDVWAFQVPPQSMSAASFANSVLTAVGRKNLTGEGRWVRVEAEPYDDEDDESADGPGARGWFAGATMGDLEENGIVIWGGLDGGNKRLGDGWIFRLG